MSKQARYVRPASDARIRSMARLLNRAYDTVAACRVMEDNVHHVAIAMDLTESFGELGPDDKARVLALCPRAAKFAGKVGEFLGTSGPSVRLLEAAR